MKTKMQRLNNIIGQIEGIKKLLEKDSDCIAVLTQLKAIKSAVSGVMDVVIEEQLETCMKSLNAKDKKLLSKIKKYV
jgi:DNA-binding FrmR family transcriptional regulator